MDRESLKVILWLLLCLPVLVAAVIMFIKVIREELEAEKAEDIND